MSKSHWARLAVAILGVSATGLAVKMSTQTAWVLASVAGGFIATSVAAEWAFRTFATAEEIRKDLEDRVRNEG